MWFFVCRLLHFSYFFRTFVAKSTRIMRRLLIIFLLLPAVLLTKAGNNRQQVARQQAATVLGTDVQLAAQAAGEHPTYYIYNTQAAGAGFAVVAGDVGNADVPVVLGYSTTGHYDAADVPPALQLWLARMEEELTMIRDGRDEPFRAIAEHEPVAPMLTTCWDQSSPYNLNAPEYEYGHRSAAGCLATAMAQIMKYYAYSYGSGSIPAYTSRDLNLYMPELPATTFDYAIMQDAYSGSDQSASAKEVAKLMKYCGQAVEMNYGAASGAEPLMAPWALYFGYNAFSYYAERHQYPAWAWDKLIYNQLSAGHPVLMTGYTFSGVGYEGHAFICHGYDGAGLYYFNWGWGGRYDGWYALSLCNPFGQGIGGSHGLDGFNIEQGAMINLFPDDIPSDVRLSVSSLTANETVVTRNSADEDFAFNVTTKIYNQTAAAHSYDLAFGLYEDYDQLLGVWPVSDNVLCMPYAVMSIDRQLILGEGMTSGQYVVRNVCRYSGTSDWLWAYNGDLYLNLTIDGNTLTISEPEPEFSVRSVTFEGSLQPHSRAIMHVTLTNAGPRLYNNLYLFVNDQQASGIGLFVDQGETDEVLLHFVVPEGDVQLKLYTDVVLMDEETQEYQPGGKLVWSGGLDGYDGISLPVVTPPAVPFMPAVSGQSDSIATSATAPVFDLQGRRVWQPTAPGLYLYQGKKYAVRRR